MIVRSSRRHSCHVVLATVLLALVLGFLGAPSPACATELIDQSFRGIAIQGYDPVAYFTDGQAVKGSDEFAYKWLGAVWYFASAEHREIFAADPVKYAPQYGGYCASAMVGGQTAVANPEAWRIVDGKLYFVYSQDGLQEWANNAPEEIKKADARWEQLRADLSE